MPLKSAQFFDLMKSGIAEQGPDLVKKVNAVITFNVAPGGCWTIDLKNGSGSVIEGPPAKKADLTINISDDDFVALSLNKLNPQQAFMQGKIKLKGAMAIAMKLQTVMNAAKAANPDLAKQAQALAAGGGGAGAGGAAGGFTSKLKSAPAFEQMAAAVKAQGADLVKKVGGVIHWKIDGEVFSVDLKNGGGFVKQGAHGKPDLTITVKDADFVQLQAGKLNPQQAFMSGRIKIAGNMGLAMKLQTVLNAAKAQAKL